MRKLNIVWKYCVLFFLLCTSCHIGDTKEKSALDRMVKQLKRISNYNKGTFTHIVVIPNVGCGGCISESEAFLKRNTNDSIFFVFTNISSLKALRLRMGDKLQQRNVYVDENNDFLFNDERIDSYPIVLQVNNPKKVEWDFLEPGNSFEQTLK